MYIDRISVIPKIINEPELYSSTINKDIYYTKGEFINRKYIENSDFEDTGFYYTLSLISGKHKMVILYCLM